MRKLRYIGSKVLAVILLAIYMTTSLGIDIIAVESGDEMPAKMTIDDEVDGNSPLLKSSESSEEDPIENVGWYFSNSGVVNSLYFDYFRIEARFTSTEDIESIEYTYSSDGTVWESFRVDTDYGISKSGDQWYRRVYVDMTDVADGTYTVRAVASTAEHSLSSEQTIIKDTIAPVVSDLTVEPNEKNSGLVLTWTNPDSDFEYVEIYRWEIGGGYDFYSAETEDIESNGGESASSKEVGIMSSWDWDSPDGSKGYWRYIDKTTENTYFDDGVAPNTTHYYIVTAFDMHGNESADPPLASGQLREQPLYIDYSYISTVNSRYADDVYIEFSFIANKVIVDGVDHRLDIISIDYEWSADGVLWQPFDPELINDDGELYYNDWYYSWYRYIYVDLSGFEDGNYMLRATAEDEEGNTLSNIEPFVKDTVSDEVLNLQVSPNEANDALVLTWENPHDLDYCEVYKWEVTSSYPSGRWRSMSTIYDDKSTYTDTSVEIYMEYTYKVVTHDEFGNESTSPPEVTGRLRADGEIAFDRWYQNNEVITAASDSGYQLRAYFKSFKEIESITFTYSPDGELEWFDLTPFMSAKGAVLYDYYTYSFYRNITINVEEPLGWSDGTYIIRAQATDIEGNTCTADLTVLKDAAPPANVTNLSAELNEDKTAVVLTWDNPSEDFSYVVIYRNNSWYARVEDDTFTDTGINFGSSYKYSIYAYDPYENRVATPTEVSIVVESGGPVFLSMSPVDDYLTNGNSIYYQAEYRDDSPITYMLFEYSEDGINWVVVNPTNTEPSKGGDNTYYFSGNFDVSWVTEKNLQIRVTVMDEEGRTATETRTATVDHVPPPAPSNLRASVVDGEVTLSWDSVEDAASYTLYREYQNPLDGTYASNWTVYAPSTSLVDTYAAKEVPYKYRVRARDTAGNYGPYSDFIEFELYSGPDIVFENGVSVFTNMASHTLRGTTDPDAEVTVNSTHVSVNGDGSFEYSLELSIGVTTLSVSAQKGGLTHNKKQRVLYDITPPTGAISSPSDGASIGGIVSIGVSYYDVLVSSYRSGADRGVLQIDIDGKGNWKDIAECPSNDGSSQYYTVTWDSTQPVGGTLLSDSGYNFRLLVFDRAGNVNTTPPVRAWSLDNTLPQTPTGLTASQGADQAETELVKLNWIGNPDIGQLSTSEPYIIYRSETSGTGYKQIGTSKTNSYIDSQSSLVPGKVYYYVIAAKDVVGNISAFSAEASAAPLADTTGPTFTSMPVSEGRVFGSTISQWYIRATDNSNRGVKQFLFAYSADGGATWTAVNLGRSVMYNPTIYYCYYTWSVGESLPEGEYILRFSVEDFSGNRTDEFRNITLDRKVDPAPTLAVSQGDGSIILTWESISDTDITSVRILRSTYLTGGYTEIKSIYDKTVTTYTDVISDMDQVYYYKLRVSDAQSNTDESNVVWSKAGDDMTPPQISSISIPDEAKWGGPSISFYVLATDNRAVTDMNAFYSLDDGETWTPMLSTKTGPTLSGGNYQTSYAWNTEGLSSGIYRIKVVAEDAAGYEGTLEVTWELDFEVSKVQNLRSTSEEGYITLEWDAVPDADINTSSTYQILYSSSYEGPFTKIGSYGAYTNKTTYTHLNLSPNVTHYYRIEVSDKYGNKSLSDVLAARTLPDDIPPSINSFSPDADSIIGGPKDQEISVYFTDNGDPLTARITVEISSDGGYTWSPLPYEIAGPVHYSGSTYRFYWTWNLRPMLSGIYTIRYKLYDGSGNYDIKDVNYQVDRSNPNPPRDLTAIYESGLVKLTWFAPLNYDVSYYNIYRSNTIEGPYNLIKKNVATSEYIDTEVINGVTYYYKVSATDMFNQEGEGSNIASVSTIGDNTPPEVVGIYPADNSLFGSIAEITSLGRDNLALASLRLQYSADEGETWADVNTIATRDWATFQWDTKASGVHGTVQVRVIAMDSAGNESDGSATKTYRVDTQGPSKVTGVEVVSSTFSSIRIEWDRLTDEDTAAYIVEIKKNPEDEFMYAGISYGSSSSRVGVTIFDLLPETEYILRVVGYDRTNNRGVESEEIRATTSPDVTPPYIVRMTSPNPYSTTLPLGAECQDNLSVKALIFQYSLDSDTWLDLARVEGEGKQREILYYTMDLSEIPEGPLFIKAVVEDAAGNFSTPKIVKFEVDRTKPSKPTNFIMTPTEGYMDISWNLNSESDILGYRLYRADREGGPFEVLMIIRPTTDSVRDRKVEAGFRYWYRFVAYDKAGNESEPVTVDGITLLPDTTAPRIHTISPYTDNKVKRDPVIMVLASDNYKLRTVKLEYQKAGTSTWTEIETKNIESRNTYYDIVSFNWRTYGLTDGEYVVRATATDFGGRVSDPFIVVYDMQISPPPTAQLTATGGPWQNELEWSGSKEDPDFAYYEVQRSTKPGGPYKHIKYTEQESYIDTDVTPGQYYYYIIRATDIYGNFSESSEKKALPISVDLTAPTAVPGYDQTVIVGMDVRFDGTGSYDNDRIVRYEWDFGDGATSMFSKPTHAYSNEGVYSVKLTVYDPADNQHTDYLTVSVMEPNKVGNMQVQVLDDETGMPIAGASVVVEFPDGSTQKSVTDATGLTFVIAQGGEYIVYAYKNEYMPAMFEAKLEDNTQSSSVVRLVKGDILVGDVNVRRLTLDEIEAAGIDTNDPENMFIFEYHAQLKFREVELEIEGGGLRELTRFEGNIIYAEPREAYCEGIGDIKIQPIIIPSDYAEVPPTIAFMVIPAEARWLKEFFEVALTLTNTASAPFNLSGCLATLNLPEGISLALTAEPQSQQIDLGVIPGGESKQARWIIRGDEEGYYTINAEFTGILQPFGDTLRREFRSAEPFRVWGGDALELTMEVQDKVDKGHPYRIKVKVENVSDIPVYMFTHEMKEANKINYIYAPNQELKKTIRELPPASTLELEYTLIPAIGIDESDPSSILKFVPKESSIVQTGGNAYIDWTLKAISIPENMPGVCPVLEQINELEEGYAELSWDAIENEEDIFGNYIKEVVGYRLYRIREDLRMSEEPEMVGEYGPEVTSCTVTERNGPRDYVLTTLIKEDGVTREVTLHAITGLDWADGFDSEILIVSPEEIGIGVETEIIITAYKDGAPLGDGTVDIGEYIKDFVLDEFGQARVKITPTEEGQIVVTVYDKAHNPVKSQVIFAMYGGQVRTPVGLKAEPGHHRLTLKWNANSEPDLAGYNVYQLIDGKWTKINESIVTETSYTVLNLDLGVAYQFCISAVTTENEESPKTRPISFTLKVPDDQTPPTVAGSIPAGNAREVPVDSSITVLFSEDLLVGPNYGEVSLLVDGKLIGFVISLSKNALTIMPNEDLPYSSVCKLTIPSGAVLDYGGNSLQKAFITTFTTEGPPDTTSPEIIASAPAADETGVSIDRNVIIVLSELVIEGETFTGIQLMKGESVVETTIEIEESLLIITPKQPLDYETIYRVFIPEGAVEDTAFNPLESDHSFSFITRLAPDLGPPVVTATTPSNNETEVSLMPVITIYFSELIEEELMASPSLNCNGRPVEIVVQVGEVIVEGTPDEPAVVDYSMLIITPVEQLDEDSVCQVTIPAGAVCDNAGNSLTDAYSFSFTTVRGADTTPPTVLSMEPANLAQLVPITSSITIHFSEKIEQADEYASIKLLVNGEQVPVTLSLQNQVLTLTPDNVLPYSAVCEVVIPAGSVADLSSNACPGWSGTFTTEEAPDTIPPDLIKTSPADNSKIGVEQRNFIFVFSELIDSIDETKISVTINNEPYIGFISTIDGNILTITLQQEYNLPYSASIAIEIQSDTIADMGGNQNPKDITVTYITEADPIPYIPPLPSTSGDDEGANSDIERTMSMFSDMTEDHWAVEEISYLCGAGIMNGFPGGIFNPRGILTRAQLAAIVARAMELVDTGIARDSLPMDVPIDHWAAGYVSVVMYAGYMQGDGNDRFRPDEPVTREELTKVMIMMLGRRNLDEIHLSALEAFEDFEEIAVWARPYVEEAVKLGITNGLDQKVFGAKAPAVRVQVAVMIYRVLKLLGKVIYPEA